MPSAVPVSDALSNQVAWPRFSVLVLSFFGFIAMVLAALGVGLGVIGALAMSRYRESLLYGTEATDPLTFTVVIVGLVGITLGACLGPALRATRVDATVALAAE